jgi:hypothetical protein
VVFLRFRVEPFVPQGGDERFDLGGDVCLRYVGLRSQSLAYPTLGYLAQGAKSRTGMERRPMRVFGF